MDDFDFGFSDTDSKEADRASNRMDNGAYEMTIVRVQNVENSTGSVSIEVTVREGEAGMEISTSFLVKDRDGKVGWGAPMVKALAYLLGVKPEPKEGKVMVWEDKKKVESVGIVYPIFHGKTIGCVMQKTINEGGVGYFGIIQFFDWRSKLTASEKKEGVTKAEKLAVTLKNLRTRDMSKKKGGGGKRPDVFGGGDGDDGDDDPI